MAQGLMHPSIVIQELRHEDEAHTCARFMATSEPWMTLQRTYEEGMTLLTDPEREVYLALVEEQVAGFTILQMTGSFIGYIQTLGVLPEWRNQGIGSRLIAFAEQRIFRETANVFICASSFNPGAQRLYRRLGYELIGELKDYIVSGHSELLMRKTIAPLREFQARSHHTPRTSSAAKTPL